MSQRHYNFGTGNLSVMPTSGIDPLPIGALQDVSVDFSGDLKYLYGQAQYPLDVSRGKIKVEIKAKSGLIDVNLYNTMFFGQTVTTGEILAALNELATVPGVSTYTVTPANSAQFRLNLGVFDANTGARLTQVAPGSEALGKYSQNATTGVLTFAAADANRALALNYTYASSTTGLTLAGNNILMGQVPTFKLTLANISKGKTQTMTFYAVSSSKLSFPFKQDDYQIADIDLGAFDDGSSKVFSWTTTGG